jgi:hypothetical protein
MPRFNKKPAGEKKVTLSEKKNVYSLDGDGLIFNLNYLATSERNIIKSNKPLLDHLSRSIKSSSLPPTIMDGSFRQSPQIDQENAERNDTPLFFPTLYEVARYISDSHHRQVILDTYLLCDSINRLEEGSSFYSGNLFLVCNSDASKLMLLYAQMNRAAAFNSLYEIEFHFYDDRKDILDNLFNFYDKYSEYIPNIVTLCLHHYDEYSKILSYEKISGMGYVNVNFHHHVIQLHKELLQIEKDGFINVDNSRNLKSFIKILKMEPSKEDNYRSLKPYIASQNSFVTLYEIQYVEKADYRVHELTESKSVDINDIQQLCEKSYVNPQQNNAHGKSALELAYENNHFHVVEYFLINFMHQFSPKQLGWIFIQLLGKQQSHLASLITDKFKEYFLKKVEIDLRVLNQIASKEQTKMCVYLLNKNLDELVSSIIKQTAGQWASEDFDEIFQYLKQKKHYNHCVLLAEKRRDPALSINILEHFVMTNYSTLRFSLMTRLCIVASDQLFKKNHLNKSLLTLAIERNYTDLVLIFLKHFSFKMPSSDFMTALVYVEKNSDKKLESLIYLTRSVRFYPRQEKQLFSRTIILSAISHSKDVDSIREIVEQCNPGSKKYHSVLREIWKPSCCSYFFNINRKDVEFFKEVEHMAAKKIEQLSHSSEINIEMAFPLPHQLR